MGILDLFKKKEKPVSLPTQYIPEEHLPDELQRFRRRPISEIPTPSPGPTSYSENRYTEPFPSLPTVPLAEPTPTPTETTSGNKMDLILQKLETIDTRLKLLEERLRR